MLASRSAFWLGLAFTLLQPNACYRVNVKKLLVNERALSGESKRGQALAPPATLIDSEPAALALTEAEANITTLIAATSSASLLEDVQSVTSQRSIGNLLAAMGLMRARMVLGVASTVLPAGLFQDASQGASPGLADKELSTPAPSPSWSSMMMRFVLCAVVFVSIFFYGKYMIEKAVSSKVGDDEGFTYDDLGTAILTALKLMIPQVMMSMLYMINEVISVLSIGRAGTKEQLAAVGLCNTMLNALIMTPTFGLIAPMDTFISTAWGSGNKALIIGYMTTARVLGLAIAMITIPVLWHAEALFLFLKQDPVVANHVVAYSRVMGMMFIPFYFGVTTGAILKNIGKPMISVLGLFVGNFFHIGCCFSLVVHGGWGNTGIAIAWASNQLVVNIVSHIYIVGFSDVREFGAFKLLLCDPRLLTSVMPYLKLAVPTMLANSAESYFWEIVTVFIGSLSTTVLAAHVATGNLQAFLYMSAAGFTGATCTMTGQYLGAGKVAMLRGMLQIFPVLCLSMWSIIFCVLQVFNRRFTQAYSSNLEVQDIMSYLLSLIGVFGFANCQQMIMQGILRGCARAQTCATIVLTAYYLVSLPICFIVVYWFRLGVYAVYASFGAATLWMCVFTTTAASKLDLNEEVKNAQARMAAEKQGAKA